MKLGARVLKTGVAIVFALFIAELLNLPNPVFAGVAAIFAIQPSIYRSYQRILDQVQGNIIGAVVAILFVLIFGHHIVSVGIAAVIVIAIMLKFKLEKALTLALVTTVIIMEVQSDNFLQFAFIRFSSVMIGVFAAFIVNILFIPPKYEVKLFKKMYSLQDDIIRWTRLAARSASEYTSMKTAIKKLNKRLKEVDTMYGLYKEERGYFKTQKNAKARKLVVYRQMITTSKKSVELLTRLHKHENEFTQLPDQFRLMLQERLDYLLTYHEQMLLKYTGKLKLDESGLKHGDEYLTNSEVTDIFIQQIMLAKQEEGVDAFASYHLLYILSRILDYEENLEHLDRLIVSYRKFHSEEKNIDLEEEFY